MKPTVIVHNEVFVLEDHGVPIEVLGNKRLHVDSCSNHRLKVTLDFGNERVTVYGKDLLDAVNNALNVGVYARKEGHETT